MVGNNYYNTSQRGGFMNKNKRQMLKSIFKGYKKMTSKIERSLKEIGIFVVRRKNHLVLEFISGDVIRKVPISNTGSDKRAGLNIVSQIMNTFFV